MNIFVLDENKEKCAEYHCDKHVVKMMIEYAQMLSTAVRLTTDNEVGYRVTHKNHPCTIWVRESLSNWLWLRDMTKFLNKEYRKRYNKDVNHKSFDVIQSLPLPNIPDIGLTEFRLAMPEHCKTSTAVESYRKYYMVEKKDFVTWKNMDKPAWFTHENN